MVDIQTERFFEAAVDHVYKNTDKDIRDECPVLIAFVEILRTVKEANSSEIMDQIGHIRVSNCPRHCKYNRDQKP
ncbi:MAG: hypothetical protein JET69_05565 [Methanomassiliicoccales archaeon]|nr:hypothetical protein [Methanomassiliicoccales archaeon]